MRMASLLVALAVPLALAAAPNPAPIPLETISALPEFRNPQLSPDGRFIAATVIRDDLPQVIVFRLTDERMPGLVAHAELNFDDLSIATYGWANSERLIIRARDVDRNDFDSLNVFRMASIRRDGSQLKRFRQKRNAWGYLRSNSQVINWLPDDPNHILAALDDEPRKPNRPQIHKVNVVTGKRVLVERNRRGVANWVADSSGNVRVGSRFDVNLYRARVTVFYRGTKEDDWEELQNTGYFNSQRLSPYRFDEDDPDILLMSTRASRSESGINELNGLLQYDLRERRIIGPYSNPTITQLTRTAREAFPERQVQIVSQSRTQRLAIARVFSDQHAPEYYLLNPALEQPAFLAAEYPELRGRELAPSQTMVYRARDGLAIPAFLTLPAAAAATPPPLVVLPHGGPWNHDTWGFNNYVQFLASRGYAVFQPQFRGSTSYGLEHEEAGYGQWGLAIQDDITDGVLWLIRQNIVDPERICILGSSFGGYAAAMGASKTPRLYACAVSINGVLDLELLSDNVLRFNSVNRQMFNKRSDIRFTSPLLLADKVEVPVLVIGSAQDTVVPVTHSRRYVRALKRQGAEVHYLELENGQHWRDNNRNERTKLAALERFLAEHLTTSRPHAAAR